MAKRSAEAAPVVSKKPRKPSAAEKPAEKKAKSDKEAPKSTLSAAPPVADFPRGKPTVAKSASAPSTSVKRSRDEDDLFSTSANKPSKPSTKSASSKQKPSKKRKIESADSPAKSAKKEDGFRVEHLNYKRLTPGPTLLLCQIVAVLPLELIVSLPNQLLGHVPITAVSSHFTQSLEDSAENSEEEDSDDESDSESSIPTLNQIFNVGQFCRAVVTDVLPAHSKKLQDVDPSRKRDEMYKNSRRVQLSLDPTKVNAEVKKADLTSGITVHASVKSIEDKGVVLDLGVEGVTAFLTSEQVSDTRLRQGQLIPCKPLKLASNGRTCTVSIAAKDTTNCALDSAPNLTSLIPGTLVSGLVTQVSESGLNIKFSGYFEGSVDLFHMARATKGYKVGQKVKGRILWSAPAPSDTPKRFALSLLPHVISLGALLPNVDVANDPAQIEEQFSKGTFLNDVKVIKIESDWGLICKDENTGVVAFAHISKVSDDHINALSAAGGTYRVGSSHKARVIGYSQIDALPLISLQPSVLAQKFMLASEVKVGQLVTGTVKNLTSSALFLDISGSINGIVWPVHYSDLKLKHPERKFKPGTSVQARVFTVDEERSKISLTLKKSLVQSELQAYSSIDELKPGVVQAIVSKFIGKDMLVELFGGMRAYVPVSEASESYIENIANEFKIGETVTVRITHIEPASSRITASIKQVSKASESKAKFSPTIQDVAALNVGDKVSAEVVDLHPNNIVLRLLPSRIQALISFGTLARHRGTSIDNLKTEIKAGEKIDNLIVVSKNADRGLVVVGPIPVVSSSSSKATSNGISSATISFNDISTGKVLSGKISSRIPNGVFVQISKGMRGKACWTEVADNYESVTSTSPDTGNSVDCIVLDVDQATRRIDLSLRPSKVTPEANHDVTDMAIETIDDLRADSRIRGFVKNITDSGLFVELGRDITARVQIKELFDDYVKDWKPRFSVGMMVDGKITSINTEKKLVELSLRKSSGNKDTSSRQTETVNLEVGDIVSGIIKRVEAYGAFIRIQGSSVSGLCHKSQFSDDKDNKNWQKGLEVGQQVRAAIVDVDHEKNKISFSMKPSLVPEEASDDDDMMRQLTKALDREGSDSSDGESEEEDDEDIHFHLDEVAEDSLPQYMQSAPPTPAKEVSIAKSLVAPTLNLSRMDWEGAVAPSNDTEQGEESDSDEEMEDAEPVSSSKQFIATEDKTAAMSSTAPTSTQDYERLVMGTPNSSYLWIQFMSHHLQLGEIDRAREIGQRALKAINYREEEEKMNIWVAILNLESSFGTPDSVEKTFQTATASNDPKKIYLRMVEIYESSGKYAQEEDLFQKFVKKFSHSSKAWTLFGQFYLNRGRKDDARALLPRSLKSLEKRKHVKTISKFAQLEFKSGDAERGRTIFEGILDSYPKKLDMWWIYIDQEISVKNTAGVRALFDRVLAQKHSSKKTKSLLKKWLAFEKSLPNNEEGENAVKQRAVEYVASLNK